MELVREGPSFTVDTLLELHANGPDNDLFLILGGDIAAGLPEWHQPQRVLSLATLAVAKRRGTSRERWRRPSPGRRDPQSPVLPHAPDRHLLDARPGADQSASADPLSGPRPGRGLHFERGPIPLRAEQTARAIATLAADRKALDIVQLDLRGIIGYADYFVICSGRSDRQVKAIHDAIHRGMKADRGLLPQRVEGLSHGRWVLMDYLDVVVHVFTPETREYYRLEQLWGEAPIEAVGAGA